VRARDHVDISGDVPSPVDLPPGCAFHPRCPIVVERCRSVVPELVPLPDDPGVSVACHRAEERLAGLALPLTPTAASAPTPAASQEDPA
jgi:peptide/nickel transport system ATP-binding protein